MHHPRHHDLLAPDDVPRHLREYHDVEDAEVGETYVDPTEWLAGAGIESTGDRDLDAATAFHEQLHEAAESEPCAACGRPISEH